MLDAEDKSALVDAFYQNLEFGTGGLRGIMGAGTNRMNKYIVGMATQGFANYILKAFPGEENLSVVVGHDCRNNSRLFAETVAAIFSANGTNWRPADVNSSERLGRTNNGMSNSSSMVLS